MSRLSVLGLFLLVSVLETTRVSAWVPAVRNNSPRIAVLFPRRRHDDATAIYSTIEDPTESLTAESTTSTEERRITVAMPKIQYTVKSMKRGWRENGVWMDEDGPRNGPPQNFWRQMADEREHNNSLDIVKELMKLNRFETESKENTTFEGEDASILQNAVLNEMVSRIEKSNSIRVPSLNRGLLGNWAPILRGGKVVASIVTDDEKSTEIPYRLRVERTAGRKLAPKTNYGIFDEHLEPGEEITVQELSGSNTVTASGTFSACPDKAENVLVEGYTNDMHGDLYMGSITYVTKYIMIMRKQVDQQESDDESKVNKGPITEIWMRIDEPE